jgi:hypothetical protein
MKALKVLLYAVVVVGAVAAFGWFFVSQLGSGHPDRLAGVLLTPPPGYVIAERGELAPADAAALLAGQVEGPRPDKVGVRFQRGGATVYWLADVPGDTLEELESAPSGTRLQTVWKGNLRERLSWAREHGDLAAPGLPVGERKNLYH